MPSSGGPRHSRSGARLRTTLTARVVELEQASPGPPKKTPENSSAPLSRDLKLNVPNGRRRNREGRPGRGRRLRPDPDEVVKVRLTDCPECGVTVVAAAGSGAQLAVRAVDRHAGAGHALYVGDRLGTAAWAVQGSLRSADQRGCLGQPVPAGSRQCGAADLDAGERMRTAGIGLCRRGLGATRAGGEPR